MSVKMEQRTSAGQLIKFVSVTDDAIDWEATYKASGLESVRKKLKYLADRDIEELVLKKDATTTLFIFKHPKRVDASRSVRASFAGTIQGHNRDLYTDIWQDNYVGHQEGHQAIQITARRDPETGLLPNDFIQVMIDNEVFDEMALAYVKISNRRAPTPEANAKK